MGLQKEMKLVRRRIERLWDEVSIYWQAAGIRGVAAVLGRMLVGYPKYISLRVGGIKHPIFLRPRTSDAEVFKDIILDGEYDYPDVSSPRAIVDVGANCGMTSIFYANRYPGAKVVALEPEPSNYAALANNAREYSNIVPLQAALWKTDGQVEVFPGWPRFKDWGKWGFRVRQGRGCRALTLTTLLRESGIERIDILKIDVEGAEREIFAECTWMDRVAFLAIELHDRNWPGCSEVVDAAAREFRKTERGFVTFYSR